MATVLHLIETAGHGGAESMLVNLAHGLRRHGHRTLVSLLRRGWLSERLEALGIQTIVEPLKGPMDVGWMVGLRQTLLSRSVDVVHAHEFAMNTYASLVAASCGVPVITTVHGKNYYPHRLRRRLAYRWVSRLSEMVAVSEDIRSFLVSRVGISASRVRTIHNGVDTERFRSDTERGRRARASLGLPADAPVVGTVGNLYPVKGQSYLIRAVARLTVVRPGLSLLIVGRGQLRDALVEEARALGVGNRVHFLGFREDIADLLQAMDVFVLPSLSEGLPVSVLEAMAAGRPVVVTNVGGLPELVEDGVNGYVVPKEAPEALAERIGLLLGDPALREAIGRRGQAAVESRFGVEAMLDRYDALYREVLRRGRACSD